jgi:hypothetical protein
MTVYFFANEELNCNRPASKEDIHKPVTVIFKGGLGQKFMQTIRGIDFSSLNDASLWREICVQ